MRLYHPRYRKLGSRLFSLFLALIILFQAGCALPSPTPEAVTVNVTVDGRTDALTLPLDSTVQDALDSLQITLGDLDRVEPPAFTFLTQGAEIKVVRVTEEIYDEEQVLPFEKQTIKNETMPEGEQQIVQVGVNGIEILTWRRLFEDGQEVSLQVLRRTTRQEALPEIVMIGSQSPFSSIQVPGRLVYLLGGSAWAIEGRTGNRRPVVTTGDLDGFVFSLSPDGQWLLFTRKSEEENQINTLWAARADPDGVGMLVDLEVSNVVHYAAWSPVEPMVVAYSTVEPVPYEPGWQSNNDLRLVRISGDGEISPVSVELDTNGGGTYGWWGMDFAWAPDSTRFAYSSPDSLGLMPVGNPDSAGALNNLVSVLPLQTGRNWAWVPGLSWGPDGNAIFTVEHAADPSAVRVEESQVFNLVAFPLTGGGQVRLASQVGMFAYPMASPLMTNPLGQTDYVLAFLSAVFPDQSETSPYRLAVIDRDGSNPRLLYPEEGVAGFDPQSEWGAWSPAPLDSGSFAIAVINNYNLFIVDIETGRAVQITGDNLVTRVDWK